MAQTSVEWYIEQLNIYGDKAFNREITLGEFHIKKQELTAQAKEMHKEEMHKCASFWREKENDIEKTIFEVYYNETFNNETTI
jgi:hypothetical protein